MPIVVTGLQSMGDPTEKKNKKSKGPILCGQRGESLGGGGSREEKKPCQSKPNSSRRRGKLEIGQVGEEKGTATKHVEEGKRSGE